MGLRDAVKAGIERTLVASGAADRRIRRGSAGTVILSYHNVVPRGEAAVGDRSLHVSQRRFGEHLDRLCETHEVVPLTSLRPGEPPRERPRAVITFDDAYRGAVTAGFEELARRGLPAAVFVPPGLLGSDGFWWDRLADPGGGGLDPAVRRHALEALGGRGDEVMGWGRRQGRTPATLPDHARPCTVDELVAAARGGAFELGSHTWSHVNLAGVPADEARVEMERGHRWLGEVDRGIRVADWLAYPYGLHSPTVVAAAESVAGRAVRVEGGAAEVGGRWVAGPHELPRINVPAGLSARGLVLRLAGFR